ncbi:hypothetical protein C8J56DRAFT_1044148 [Mycena floridula]|nr:hypothetical protein C8J56DRAFT_1044148 [Mycena floridula]
MTAVGIWSEVLAPGQKVTVTPIADIHITMAALGDVVEDSKSRTTVKLIYQKPVAGVDDDEDEVSGTETTTVVCSLIPGQIEQVITNLILLDKEDVTFEVVGKNTVYLTGNFIDQGSMEDGFDSDSDMEEGAYHLDEVSSDVEVDPAELDSDASRFEDVPDAEEKPAKSAKRPRDSDMAVDGSDAKPEKKSKKKLKAEDGQAVPADGEKKEKKKEKAAGVEKELAGGLKIVDATVGTGPQAKKGNTVSMRYIGKLLNGKIFDQNTKGKAFTFRLGQGSVIKGWDEGIVGMAVGGERKLTIPAAMAYGKKGQTGIPANSTLVFDVKLLEIKK